MKKNLIIIISILIISILVIAGIAFFIQEYGEKEYSVRVGDFTTYRTTWYPSNQSPQEMTMTVVGVNATHIHKTQLLNLSGYHLVIHWNETKDQSWLMADMTDPPAWAGYEVNVTYLGTDTIDFSWGAKSVDNYSFVFRDYANITGTFWIRNGLLVKSVTYNSNAEGYVTTLLIDSNMAQVRD
jgi:hypothetical protein